MRISIYVLALAPIFFVGCAEEPTTVTTTTTTREVTTTGPAAPEVVVTQAPPAVRVESQTVIPGPGYVWTPGYWRWTGTDYVWVSGSWVMPPQPTACVGSGSLGAQIGRLGVDRGPLAVKIELVASKGSHYSRFKAARGLTHRRAIVGAFFSIARNGYTPRLRSAS